MSSVIKHTIAGPLNELVIAQVPDEVIRPKRRGARVNQTSLAQLFYNDKRSWIELKLWIAANFPKDALVVTFTYSDDCLPANKKEADKIIAKLNRRMRRARKRRGAEWKYIYCTEGFHGKSVSDFLEEDGHLEDKRLHHHMIVNKVGSEDYDEIRSLWLGGGYVRIEPFDVKYCAALAQYMTKEAREFGRAKPGERSWRKSKNLTKYKVEYKPVEVDGLAFTPPKGAVDYEAFHEKNPYGFADHIGARYFLFEKEEPPKCSYIKERRKKKRSPI